MFKVQSVRDQTVRFNLGIGNLDVMVHPKEDGKFYVEIPKGFYVFPGVMTELVKAAIQAYKANKEII